MSMILGLSTLIPLLRQHPGFDPRYHRFENPIHGNWSKAIVAVAIGEGG